jgi:hypothetical protein
MGLTDQQKEFYNALEGTFRTPGWALMVQGWTTEAEGLAAVIFHNAKTMDDVHAARVRYSLLNELIGLESLHQTQREQLEEADDHE